MALRARHLQDGPDLVAADYVVLTLAVIIMPWVSKIVVGRTEVDLDDQTTKRAVGDLEESARFEKFAMARAAEFVAETQADLALRLREIPIETKVGFETAYAIVYHAAEVLSRTLQPLTPGVDYVTDRTSPDAPTLEQIDLASPWSRFQEPLADGPCPLAELRRTPLRCAHRPSRDNAV